MKIFFKEVLCGENFDLSKNDVFKGILNKVFYR